MRPKIPLVALAMTLLACSYQDVPHHRRARTLVVDEVGPGAKRITLHSPGCPTSHVVFSAGDRDDSRRHRMDVKCLEKLAAGSTVDFVTQRERQGCMPGAVHTDLLGGCTIGNMVELENGDCPTDPEHQVETPD